MFSSVFTLFCTTFIWWLSIEWIAADSRRSIADLETEIRLKQDEEEAAGDDELDGVPLGRWVC